MVETQLSKLRDTSDTRGRACAIPGIPFVIWCLWITSTMWWLILSSTSLRLAVRACSMFIPHEIYRSVTPLGTTRVNRTVLQGRCGPLPFCARIQYNPHRGRGKICMILLYIKTELNIIKQKMSSIDYNTRIKSGYISYERQFEWWDERNQRSYTWYMLT